MYEAEAANPPFGKHLKEAVLLVGAAITPYGEPNKGGGVNIQLHYITQSGA